MIIRRWFSGSRARLEGYTWGSDGPDVSRRDRELVRGYIRTNHASAQSKGWNGGGERTTRWSGWLYKNSTVEYWSAMDLQWGRTGMYKAVQRHGRVEVVAWLREHYPNLEWKLRCLGPPRADQAALAVRARNAFCGLRAGMRERSLRSVACASRALGRFCGNTQLTVPALRAFAASAGRMISSCRRWRAPVR